MITHLMYDQSYRRHQNVTKEKHKR